MEEIQKEEIKEDTIEKPKKSRRPITEKQAQALKQNRIKAAEKTKENFQLLKTIKQYNLTPANNSLGSKNNNIDELKNELKYIRDFVDETKKRKEEKKKAKELVEKDEYYNYINNVNNDIFFR